MLCIGDRTHAKVRAKRPPSQEGDMNLYWSTRGPILVREQTYIGHPSDHYRLLFHPLQDASASLTSMHFLPAHLRWIIPLKVYDLHHTHHLSHSLIPSIIPEEYPQHCRIGISTFPTKSSPASSPSTDLSPGLSPRNVDEEEDNASVEVRPLQGVYRGKRGNSCTFVSRSKPLQLTYRKQLL